MTTETITPQVTYYREYQLKDADFIDAKLEFDETTNTKANFELALYKKIFGISNLTDINGKILYGIGQPKGTDGRKYIFGVIYLNTYKATEGATDITVDKTYIFIYGCKASPAKGVLRAHQIVTITNTQLITNSDTKLGLFADTSCIVGINQENNIWYFYLPSKSFCLEGSHRDIVELPSNYEGKFTLTIPQ